MKNIFAIIALLSAFYSAEAQYTFTDEHKIACTEVKSQQNTGTCWSFATSSFLESELMRMGKPEFNLSEMFVARNIYKDKAYNYVLRQGKANFSQGSLSHDVINVVAKYGIVPEDVYSGKLDGEEKHNHSEMEKALKGMLDGILKQKKLTPKWKVAFEGILDAYVGDCPEKFNYEGKSFSAESFSSSLGINPEDYVSITSYTHHPFYEQFILEIPDNYSNGVYYNIPMEEMQQVVDSAVKNGYTVAWDGDVSEKGFSAKEGLAILPKDAKREDLFTKPGAELAVTQALRQETFESYSTTDDHLMHLTGTAKDQNGDLYYLIKNSWGPIGNFKGYLYMSDNYLQLKTVAIMVHKSAIPAHIAKKINL